MPTAAPRRPSSSTSTAASPRSAPSPDRSRAPRRAGRPCDGPRPHRPGSGAALKNGSDVVVRYGRQVTVQTDGAQSDVWLTALDADEALETLAARGGDVRLVASRSGADGRAALSLRLDADGPVNVVADGETKTAPDGSIGVNAILDQQGVVLGELDRVSVARAAEPAAAEPPQVSQRQMSRRR
ncbi:ubiquitin-like domain-containing protein [Oerskovia sp. M15]